MPIGAVRIYSKALPALLAEEQLAAINTAMAGNSARMELSDVQDTQRSLEAAARGGRKKRSRKASADALAAMGIGAVIEQPGAAAESEAYG